MSGQGRADVGLVPVKDAREVLLNGKRAEGDLREKRKRSREQHPGRDLRRKR